MATTTIGPSTKEIVAKHAKLYITTGGSRYFFAAAKGIRIRYAYDPIKEEVCGSQIRRVLTGPFDGDFEPEVLYTSDSLLELNKVDATTLEVPVCTVEIEGKDVVSPQNTRRITVTVKLFDMEVVETGGGGVLRVRARGTLTAYPNIAPA